MRDRLLFGFLPCYGSDRVDVGAPSCFAALRAAQVFDSDLADDEVGVHHRERAPELSGPGEGMSLMLASQEGDVVLIRANGAPELRDRVSRVREHLGRCGIATGQPALVEEPERELRNFGDSHFICTAIFGADVAKAFGADPAAERHRRVIRDLQNKLASYRVLAEAGLPVASIRVLDSAESVDRFTEAIAPPWVLKAAHGAAGVEVVHAATTGEVQAAWERFHDAWGTILGESFKPATRDVFVYFVLDPHEESARFVISGELLLEGTRVVGNVWSEDFESRVDQALAIEIANAHLAFARAHGASAFHEAQDWRDTPEGYLESNPRLGAGTAIALYRSRCSQPVERVMNLQLPAPESSVETLLRRLADIEATPERGEGVVVYSAAQSPWPHVLALVVNDRDGRAEAALRRAL